MSGYVLDRFGLEGKVAVVIGATGELGGAIAEGLCRAGADTVLAGRNEAVGEQRAARLDALGDGAGPAGGAEAGAARFERCDTTERAELEALARAVDGRFGRVDVLVNSAGVNAATPFLEITEGEWDRIMAVNLKGVFLACQVFGRYLLEQGTGGSIINVSSMAGMTPLSRVFTYSASKAGLINLTRNLAREWAEEGIRVNGLAPGFFPAEQNRKILTDERVGAILGHTPAGRFGEAEELVGAALLLASERAGGFITGANLPVDGGFAAMTI